MKRQKLMAWLLSIAMAASVVTPAYADDFDTSSDFEEEGFFEEGFDDDMTFEEEVVEEFEASETEADEDMLIEDESEINEKFWTGQGEDEEEIEIDADALGSSEELFAEYVDEEFGVQMFSDGSDLGNGKGLGYRKLSGDALALYKILRSAFAGIADGQIESTEVIIPDEMIDRVFTAEELGLDAYTGAQSDKDALKAALEERYKISLGLDYLLADCPYDLYWYNKGKGGGVSYGYKYRYNSTMVEIIGLTFDFTPATAYSGVDEYTVDTSLTSAAKNSAVNARAIAAQAADLSDYDKLLYFKDQIIGLTDYNHYAVEHKTGESSDPWQLIYVFDGDPDTTVVCEGYSKAFQYLYEVSSFNSNIESYIVTGDLIGGTGAGGHMWNIVRMEDGNNYIVDVTNCDDGTIGEGGKLFLAGTPGSVESGYRFEFDALNHVGFTYDADTLNMFTREELTLASENYKPGQYAPQPDFLEVDYADGMQEEMDVNEGDDLTLAVTASANTKITYQWYINDTKIDGATAATYTIKEAAEDASYTCKVANASGDEAEITFNVHVIPEEIEDENIIAEGTCGADLRWKLDDEGTITICGTGEMYDYLDGLAAGLKNQPWVTYAQDIKKVVIGEGVTSIGDCAFYNHTNIEEIVFSDTVTSIGFTAFKGCNITNLELPESLQVLGQECFDSCTLLKEVRIPGHVSLWELGCFDRCSSLEKLYIDWEFDGPFEMKMQSDPIGKCEKLEAIEVNPNHPVLKSIDGVLYYYGVFYYGVLMQYPAGKKDEVYTIVPECYDVFDFSFNGARYLKTLIIPETVLRVTNNLFNSSDLTLENIIVTSEFATRENATIFYNVNNVNIYCPSDASEDFKKILLKGVGTNVNLILYDEHVVLDNHVVRERTCLQEGLEEGACVLCGDTIQNIIPAGHNWSEWQVTKRPTVSENGVRERICSFCQEKETEDFRPGGTCGVNLNWSIDQEGVLTITTSGIGTGIMDNYSAQNTAPWAEYANDITKVVFEDGVTTIGKNAFSNYTHINSVEFPDTLTSIGEKAFYGCSGLSEIEFPNSLKSIGTYAFSECVLIKELNIPGGVSIFGYAFRNCSSLEKVYFDWVNGKDKYPSFSFPFEGCPKLKCIESNPEHPTYKTVDGVLYIDGALTYYPVAKTDKVFTIDKECNSVKSYSFLGIQYLETLIIPDNVKNLDSYIFKNRSGDVPSIKNIIITGEFTQINDYGPFWYMSNTDLYYPSGLSQATLDALSVRVGTNFNMIPYDEHVVLAYEKVKDATCTEEGSEEGKCLICGETFTNTIPATGHSWNTEYTVDKEASCTATGSESIHCKNCDATKDARSIAKKAHEIGEWTVVKEATCTVPGSEKRTCKNCDYSETQEIAKTEHVLTDWTVVKAAGCEEDGQEERHCKNCDFKETRVIAATGHSMGDWTVVKEATCTESGEGGHFCQNCDFKETQEIAAAGHSMGDWTVMKEATCTEPGSEKRTCENCDYFETQETRAKGHIWGTEYAVDKEPTCTAEGNESIHCKNCDATKDARSIAKAAHELGDWTVVKAPTCTEDGSEERTCKNCDYKETRAIAATGHSMGDWTVVKEATCTEKGSEKRTCKNCDHYETQETRAKGHIWNTEYTVDKEATCTVPGSESIHCKNCDASKDAREIAKKAHELGDWTVVKAPSCTVPGSEKRTCKNCDYSETREIAKTEHTLTDWAVEKAASCEEDGQEEHHCKNCDFKETRPIAKIEHQWSEWQVTKEATTKEEGEQERSCSVCHKTETKAIPMIEETDPIEAFVTRMYQVCLNRKPDANGLAYWSEPLRNQTKSGLDVATGFVYSNEFQKKDMTDEEFITYMYNAFLGRGADQGGMNYWLGQLAKGKTRDDVFMGFADSNEFDRICKDYGIVKKFEPEEIIATGLKLNVTTQKVKNGKTYQLTATVTPSDASNKAVTWTSSKPKIATVSDKGLVTAVCPGTAVITCTTADGSNIKATCTITVEPADDIEAFVIRLYSTCLNRNPDATGLKYWADRLRSKKETGRSAAHGFIFSDEFINRKYNDEDFIEQMYKAFFGRGSDKGGKTYWLNEMKKGKTREDVFDGFVVSNEFAKMCEQYGIARD